MVPFAGGSTTRLELICRNGVAHRDALPCDAQEPDEDRAKGVFRGRDVC